MTDLVQIMDNNKEVATRTHCVKTRAQYKLLLIDENAEMPTRAKRKQAERLSEVGPKGHAIVRTYGKSNRMK